MERSCKRRREYHEQDIGPEIKKGCVVTTTVLVWIKVCGLTWIFKFDYLKVYMYVKKAGR